MKLPKILIAAAWALSVALASAAEVDPPSVVGRLNYISGPVSFAPAQANEDWLAATLNRPLTTGDRLWTDSNGRAEMHVGSLAIRMAAQTSMDVLTLDDRTLQLRVAQGNVILRVRRLSSDRLLEIATPNGAVVVMQPGAYRISVDPSGTATMVAVRGGGQAEVFTGNSSFAVRDNQEAAISGSGQDLFAAPPPDEFDRWAAGRDQREDRVASTRYVPDEMTGYEDLDQYGAWRTVSDYGAVWVPATVPAGWAPYRYGHWVWISPWGWTWVDDAPWGFAPFHYGRWVWLGNHWAWAPGRVVARPVYSPAMVAFIGGSNFSVSVGFGSAPAVAWVPLGWREPYIPWYRASRAHVQNVNVTHVTNVTNITHNVTNITYVNRTAPSAVTVVSRENFVAARQVQQASLNVPVRTLAAAPVTQGAPVAAPVRTSLAASQPGSRPPAEVTTREAVAVNTPPAPVRDAVREGREDRRGARFAGNGERPRVRVINQQERVNLPVSEAQRAATPAAQSAAEAPRANAPARSASDAQQPQPQAERGGARSAESAVPQPRPNQPDQARAGERAPEKGIAQPRPQPDPANRGERGQQQAAPQPQPGQQAERRAPGPPPEVPGRPTFDRDMRATTSESRREQRQPERRERLEQSSGQGNGSPRAQAVPQSENRTTMPRPAPDVKRTQQQEQQQAQVQQAREQQARQQELQRQQQAAQEQRAQQQQRELQAALASERRAAPQRVQESHEKGSRERPRADRSEKD